MGTLGRKRWPHLGKRLDLELAMQRSSAVMVALAVLLGSMIAWHLYLCEGVFLLMLIERRKGGDSSFVNDIGIVLLCFSV